MNRLIYAGLIATTLGVATNPALAAPELVPRPAYAAPQKVPDARLYEEIFNFQEAAKWNRADRLIKRVEDPVLMGHVLFQRYMHPTGYRAKWTELRDWLKNYADHPGAWRIYKLAQKRKPRGVNMPKRPPPRVYFARGKAEPSPLFRSRAKRRIKNRVSYLVRRERPTQALKYISDRAQSRRLSQTESDFLKSLIARSYYIEGKVPDALKLATQAARSRRYAPLADWHAGLAAFRLGQNDTALVHFEQLAQNRFASPRLRAQASYWTARSLRKNGDIVKAEQHFRAAAATGPHFYALLAQQHVTDGLTIDWRRADLAAGNILATHPVLRRADALRAAAQDELAELELLYLQERVSDIEARALLSYARDNGYPAAQLALASRLSAGETNGLPLPLYESAFPTLPLEDDEISIDRALLFGLIRQESRFKARAKSHAGARGLMQIMPGTAAFISGDRRLARRSGRNQLLDMDLNLALGQKYLTMLLGDDYFKGNLILAVAAYNAGPGNVRRWRRELADVQDPLLFIESLPAPETRDYVHKVMRNMWIYRERLAQEATGHRVLAAESWPTYRQQDKRPVAMPASVDR